MQSNEIEVRARKLYEQNNPNREMDITSEWHYISKSRKDYYRQLALDEMNKPTNELMINEKTIEMEVLESQEGREAIKKFQKKGKVQLTPTDKLNVINISINDTIKQIKELNITLKELKRKQKKLTKALKEIDNI